MFLGELLLVTWARFHLHFVELAASQACCQGDAPVACGIEIFD